MELVESENNRVEYLDKAKGIGILLVCVGHACTNQELIMNCQLVDVIRFITLFHMALFFFINGILYHEKYSQKPMEGILKKFKAYYIPFVKYNLFFWALHNLFSKLHLISGALDNKDYPYIGVKAFGISFLKSLIGYRQKFAGAMWFLECLVVISVIFIVLDFVISKTIPQKRTLILSISIISIVVTNRLFNLIDIPYIPNSISQMIYWGINGLLFFYLGYIYKTFHWNEHIARYKYPVAVVTLVILIIAVCLMRPQIISVITNAGIPIYKYGVGAIIGDADARGLSLVHYLFYCLVSFAGIILVLMVSQFKFLRGSKAISLLGRYSLHIMCLQFLAFKFVSLFIIVLYKLPIERLAEYPVIRDINGLWWIAYTIAGCVIPVLCAKAGEKLTDWWKSKRPMKRTEGHSDIIDMMKGIGILLVVIAHSGFCGNLWILLFHMPLFFMISGYCFRKRNCQDVKSLVILGKKRLRSLWIPFVVSNVCFLLLHNCFVVLHIYSTEKGSYTLSQTVKGLLKIVLFTGSTEMGGTTWFFETLFFATMLFACLLLIHRYLGLNVSAEAFSLSCSVVLLLLGWFCSLLQINVMGIGTILSACILLSIGMIIKEKQIMEGENWTVHKRILGILLSFTVLCLVCYFVKTREIQINFGMNRYGNPLLLVLCSIIGWVLVYNVACVLGKVYWCKKVLIYLGQNTIPIMILHFLAFKLVSFVQIIIYKEPISALAAFPVLHCENVWWVAYCVVGIIIPLLFNEGYRKVKKIVLKNNRH